MFKNKIFVYALIAAVAVAALHYMYFVSNIRDNEHCFSNLLKAQYDNQNLLTQQFYQVTVVDKSQNPADIDRVFKDHFARLEALNKQFVCGQ